MTPGQAVSQAPPEYLTPRTLTPNPRSPPASQLHGPRSAPAIEIPVVHQDELLDEFFERYIEK